MRKFLIILTIFVTTFTLGLAHSTYSTEKYDHDCSRCHSLTNEEAQDLLKDVGQGIKILSIDPIPAKGFWEVAIESQGKKGILYVDLSKRYLFFGSLVDIRTKTNLTQEKMSQLNKVDVSTIPLDDALVMGDKDAKQKVIVFDDPD